VGPGGAVGGISLRPFLDERIPRAAVGATAKPLRRLRAASWQTKTVVGRLAIQVRESGDWIIG